MNKFRVLMVLVFTIIGCVRSPSNTPTPETAAQQAPSSTAERSERQNVLHIKPEMLRDLKITTAEVERRVGAEGAMLLGELRVNENAYAEVRPTVTSRVVSLTASAGQSVRRGQTLAMLQSSELGRARSDLMSAKAKLALARQTLDRKTRLASERIVAQRDVQEAEATLASSEAELQAAEASLRSMGTAPESFTDNTDTTVFALRSPIDGTVIERSVVVGQVTDSEHLLFRIGDLSTLWLTVQAFERDAVRIRPGAPARIMFAALPGQTLNGRVDLIGKQVSPESRTVPIRIVVRNVEGLLRPGMSATAWVTPGTGTDVVLTLPAASLQRVEENWVVFIPMDSGTFEVRTVGRGRDLGGEVEILSGLGVGETVVMDGAFLLKAELEKSHSEGEQHDH